MGAGPDWRISCESFAGYLFALVCAQVVISGNILLKIAAEKGHRLPSPYVAAGTLLYAVSAIGWFIAMRHISLAQAAWLGRKGGSGHSLRAHWRSGVRQEAVVQPVNQSDTLLIDTKGGEPTFAASRTDGSDAQEVDFANSHIDQPVDRRERRIFAVPQLKQELRCSPPELAFAASAKATLVGGASCFFKP